MYLEQLNQHISERPSLDFGSIFSRSIALFQNVWLQGFITLLLTVITILPLYILFYIPLIAAGITDPEMLKSEEPPTMVIVGMAILFPVLLLGILTFGLALNAAFLRICRTKDMEAQGKDDYFYFFKKGRMGKAFTLAVIMLGLSLLGLLACGVGLIYLAVPLSLFPAFLAFKEELTPMEMVKASFVLGNKNWLVIFGLLIVLGIIAELGIILCFIGVLFTAMLSKVPIYYMYKDGVGFEHGASIPS